MRKFFFSIISLMMVTAISAQSVDFVERASKILWNGTGTKQVSWGSSDEYVTASSARYDISGNKTFYRFKNLSGFPVEGIEVWPNKEWQLHWNYSNDHKERVGLCPVRDNGDGADATKFNYIGIPDLAVGDIVTVISKEYPTKLDAATTATGTEDKTGTQDITFTFGNSQRTYEGAKVYTFTVSAAGKLALQFANSNYIYSIDIKEPYVNVKVDLDFESQARTAVTEGQTPSISDFTDNSVRIKENSSESNTTFYTPAYEGLTMHSNVSVAPNSGWLFANQYDAAKFRIGLVPNRNYNDATPNKVGITNLAVGDIVVIKSLAAPTEWSASIGTGNSTSDTHTFAYGDKNNRTQTINVYTYNVTTAGSMAWSFPRQGTSESNYANTIISIKVYRNETRVKEVANNYPVSISGNWASFCAAEDVALPSGVYAYIAGSNTTGEDATLYINKVESSSIPANTGVLLYSETDGDYNLTTTTEASAIGGTNLLVGTVVRTANPSTTSETGTTYSLYDTGSEIIFARYTGAYIPSNKAYLDLSASGLGMAPKRFRVQVGPAQTPTGVEAVERQEPMANSQKLLINGQLVIIRDGVKYNVQGQIIK